MSITYAIEPNLSASEFRQVLTTSGLAERRPVDDGPRLKTMLERADLIVVARNADGRAIGVARSITDFAYCLYCSDLAVDRAYQRRGIGERLLDETAKAAPGVKTCLLLSAPGAVTYYEHKGYDRLPDAFRFHERP